MAALAEVCELCGRAGAELLSSNAYTGEFHSACNHAACEDCIREYVLRELPRRAEEGLLRVPCFASGCTRLVAHKLVLQVASGTLRAAEQALAKGESELKACGVVPVWEFTDCAGCHRRRSLKFGGTCGHLACEECWHGHFATQLTIPMRQLHLSCLHPDCNERFDGEHPVVQWASTRPEFLPKTLVYHQARRRRGLSKDADAMLDFLQAPQVAVETERGGGPWSVLPCQICAEPLTVQFGPAGCPHRTCHTCWCKWSAEQMPRCLAERTLSLRCIDPACRVTCEAEHPLCRMLGLPASAAVIGEEGAVALRALERRRRLQSNTLFPPCMQVDCPQPGCVGLGYLGQDTVMCFVCEHLWLPAPEPAAETPTPGAAEGTQEKLAPGVKCCPKCTVPIAKDGGCDHMTCRCKYEFWWSTLAPYRVT